MLISKVLYGRKNWIFIKTASEKKWDFKNERGFRLVAGYTSYGRKTNEEM